jgi:predicted RNase H-like nuclease (RuvC/YqgF family)
MPKPKGEPTTLARISKRLVSEVQEFKAKKGGFENFEKAMILHILANVSWKEALVEREEKIEQRFKDRYVDLKKDYDDLKNTVEPNIKRNTALENDNKALKSKIIEKDSEIGKLKAVGDKISRLESEDTQKESENAKLKVEIVKLKAEREKGPSPEIMKEHSEMKERIQSLELKLNEALKGKTESPSFYDDDWLPEYWPFANMEEYKTWFESE